MSKKDEKNCARDERTPVKRSFAERMGTVLDIPADLLCGGCYMEMRGRNELTLSGCRRIVGYSSHEIILRLRRGSMQIRGRNMTCTAYHSGCITIGGWIGEISFCDAEDSE